MQLDKLRHWSSWNRPALPKVLAPVFGGLGVIVAHLLLLFVLGVSRNGIGGVTIYVVAVGVGFGCFWLISMLVLARLD